MIRLEDVLLEPLPISAKKVSFKSCLSSKKIYLSWTNEQARTFF